MADDQAQDDTAQDEKANDTSDINARIEAAVAEATAKASERFKSEIAGLNRRNSELENTLEEQKKASMSEKEKLEYELNKEKAEIQAARADFLRMQNKAKAIAKASELGVPTDLLDTIPMDNWEAVETQINKIKTVVDSLKSQAADSFAKSTGDRLKPGKLGSGKSAAEMTADEMTTLWKANPDEARALLASLPK